MSPGVKQKPQGRSQGRARRRHRPPPGAQPGTLAIQPGSPKPVIRVMAFSPDALVERELTGPARIADFLGQWPVVWINVDGLGDADTLRAIADIFKLHPLALADVVNVHQRPKVEPYPDHTFIVMRMISGGPEPRTEQVSLFLGQDFVLSFQERAGDCFDPMRERIRQSKGRVRGAGPDYVAYLLLDAVIDNYFPILDRAGDRIEELEDAVMQRPEPAVARRIHDAKRELLSMRRAIWPQREAISTLLRDESPLITQETRLYLRDCYDHTIQIMDMVETHRELASGLMDVYLSSVNNRMSEAMRMLTIIATIFIPLTFIAGVYGMNFEHMPELEWRWGYPAVLLLMSGIAGGMLMVFRRRHWIGTDSRTVPSGPDGPRDAT